MYLGRRLAFLPRDTLAETETAARTALTAFAVVDGGPLLLSVDQFVYDVRERDEVVVDSGALAEDFSR